MRWQRQKREDSGKEEKREDSGKKKTKDKTKEKKKKENTTSKEKKDNTQDKQKDAAEAPSVGLSFGDWLNLLFIKCLFRVGSLKTIWFILALVIL